MLRAASDRAPYRRIAQGYKQDRGDPSILAVRDTPHDHGGGVVGTIANEPADSGTPIDMTGDKDRLDFTLEATGVGSWTYHRASEVFVVDARGRDLLGLRTSAEVEANVFVDAVRPDDQAMVRELVAAVQNGETRDRDLDVRLRHKPDEPERWVALRSRMIKQAHGNAVIGTLRDVTDARSHDQQIHLLMREVTHRSKNLLAIIQAMARQTVKDSLTAADFEVRFSSRLRGLSFSHEILAAQDWRGAALHDLARGHLGHVLEQYVSRIEIGGPSVFIRPEAAQNIGLALNELTSNALKFGALSGNAGNVSFKWFVDDEPSAQRWLHVVWSESGGSTIEPPLRQGFGHKVMERVVARALDGVVNMTFAPTGLQWSLRIPVWYIVQDPAEA